MKKQILRNRHVGFNVSEKEYSVIIGQLDRSTYRSVSEFLRGKILEKPLVERVHNTSVDRVYETLAEIKTDLQQACDSFDRCADQIKEYVGSAKIETELMDLELKKRKLLLQLQKAFDRISKLADQ